MTWNQAKLNCEALGSKFVVITSQAEQQAIGDNFNFGGSPFIGLHRDPQDSSRWLWVDGSRPNYTNWDQGEPSSGERVVMRYFPPYAWDVVRAYYQPSICKTDCKSEPIMFCMLC